MSALSSPPKTAEPAAPTVPASAERMAKLNMVIYVVQTVVIALFGFALTGRIDLALKERQTNVQERQAVVQSVGTMSALLTKINDESIKDDVRERTVLQVAMYGSDAIYPLFVMAVSKSAYSPGTAIPGLRLLAVQHRAQVCELLLGARTIPNTINEIRKTKIDELTNELKCASVEKKP